MVNNNRVKKICGFYASSVHLVTMLLPYLKNQINDHVQIETIFEYSLKEDIKNILKPLLAVVVLEKIMQRLLE